MKAAGAFYCPMHADVHSVDGGKCPHCKMDLIPEGTRFGIMRHMLGNPHHIAVMVGIMIIIMAAIMMMR